ncbi:hypothetical protein BN874_1860024 [Candidatus Contendobacter odensis Run_B_J11]|uniref:Uncharacterized protein n=1 Tax=Candidatus Contendobacter odensis Run_B_J11 TaxID=1400861 RepID=A0A7U7J413_9GAMM|nr:hypothetical protein BN874_1860024 [Candidatus Contendobacter odensis Run_B_J11]
MNGIGSPLHSGTLDADEEREESIPSLHRYAACESKFSEKRFQGSPPVKGANNNGDIN